MLWKHNTPKVFSHSLTIEEQHNGSSCSCTMNPGTYRHSDRTTYPTFKVNLTFGIWLLSCKETL